MTKKYSLFIVCTLSILGFSCQESSPKSEIIPLLTEEEIIEKYVKNGAWQVGDMYSQAWQDKLDEGIAEDSTIAYLWQQKAMPLFKQMKYNKALQFLDHAVRHDEDKYLEYRAFMKCIFVKDYEAALEDFQAAKEKYGNRIIMDHSYDFYIGISLLQMNEFEKAYSVLSNDIQSTIKAEGQDFLHFLDLFYLGIAHYELGNYKESIIEFDKAIEIYSTFSDAMYYKSQAMIKLGNRDEGILLAKKAKENKDYTINEDNSLYERYPYKVNWKVVWWLD